MRFDARAFTFASNGGGGGGNTRIREKVAGLVEEDDAKLSV